MILKTDNYNKNYYTDKKNEIMQWLGSYCDQRGEKCCYPPTGKPGPEFSIYGFWPYYNDGSFPYNCGGGNFDEALVSSSSSLSLSFLVIFEFHFSSLLPYSYSSSNE